MRYQMDNYEQPTRRQMRPTETEDVAVKVRVKGHVRLFCVRRGSEMQHISGAMNSVSRLSGTFMVPA